MRGERIITTLPKTKELRPFIQRSSSLLRWVKSPAAVESGERFKGRPGGYTRTIRLGRRDGDKAEMAIIELVDKPRKHTAPTGWEVITHPLGEIY